MKQIYIVRYKCYHYNTGYADNHSYFEEKEFSTLEEAIKYKHLVDSNLENPIEDFVEDGYVLEEAEIYEEVKEFTPIIRKKVI